MQFDRNSHGGDQRWGDWAHKSREVLLREKTDLIHLTYIFRKWFCGGLCQPEKLDIYNWGIETGTMDNKHLDSPSMCVSADASWILASKCRDGVIKKIRRDCEKGN